MGLHLAEGEIFVRADNGVARLETFAIKAEMAGYLLSALHNGVSEKDN